MNINLLPVFGIVQNIMHNITAEIPKCFKEMNLQWNDHVLCILNTTIIKTGKGLNKIQQSKDLIKRYKK